MNNMRNLEKLGILVIVILVVVVGVVAITPGEQLDKALDLAGNQGEGEQRREVLPQDSPPYVAGNETDEFERLPTWPEDDGGLAVNHGAGIDDKPRNTVDPLSRRTDPVALLDDPKKLVPEPKPAPEKPRSYTTRTGDSFYRIAERELGDLRQVSALMAANPGIKPTSLGVGIELRLPVLAGARSDTPVVVKAPKAGDKQPSTPRRASGPGGTYVVKSGDNLYDIASAELGKGERWIEIARLNVDVLKNSTRLSVGMKLRMPGSRGGDDGITAARDPSPTGVPVIGSGSVANGSVANGSEASGSEANGSEANGSEAYVVQKNDTLSSIAAARLGGSGRWHDIVKLNDDQLHGSDRIREGMTLRLPKR